VSTHHVKVFQVPHHMREVSDQTRGREKADIQVSCRFTHDCEGVDQTKLLQ
jgi:hypothetical protein